MIKIIRGSADRAQASERLQDRFGLSELQADAILNMRLARLTALQRTQLEARLGELEAILPDGRSEVVGPRSGAMIRSGEFVPMDFDARETERLQALRDRAVVI